MAVGVKKRALEMKRILEPELKQYGRQLDGVAQCGEEMVEDSL